MYYYLLANMGMLLNTAHFWWQVQFKPLQCSYLHLIILSGLATSLHWATQFSPVDRYFHPQPQNKSNGAGETLTIFHLMINTVCLFNTRYGTNLFTYATYSNMV